MPYEQYVTGHILKPLGMERSAATQPLPNDLADDLSKGYHYKDGTYEAKDFEWISNAPSAPVHATSTDMARFMLAHLQNGEYGGARILRESIALDMHRQHFTHDPRLSGWTYGFAISRENDRHIIWHDGDSARFQTMLALLPEEHTGLFVSYNTPFDPRETLSAFLDHYYPLKEKPPPQPPPRLPSASRALDGHVYLDAGGPYQPAKDPELDRPAPGGDRQELCCSRRPSRAALRGDRTGPSTSRLMASGG